MRLFQSKYNRAAIGDEIFLKLMEMGCIPGELITVEQIAPLGDPISISVAGYQLSLRMNEADSIFINPNIEITN